MIDPADLSYKVKIWKTEEYVGARVSTFTVRWRVGTKRFREPHRTRAQADAFRSQLVQAQARGEGFTVHTGRPVSMLREERREESWYSFCCRYVDHKWPDSSAKHRENMAWALMQATTVLFTTDSGQPDALVLRRALFRWAFNTKKRQQEDYPPEIREALHWAERNSRHVSDLADQRVTQAAVKAATTRLDGTKCKVSSRRRNHGILRTALAFAVEEGLLAENPVEDLEGTTAGRTVHQVDRRCVVNHTQARALLDAVATYGYEESTEKRKGFKSGPRLVAFFGSMYYSGLRPEEAINLHKHNLSLPPPKVDPETGDRAYEWGEFHLERSAPDAGPDWTDSGNSRDDRPLKQREEGEGRNVPCPPELTELLWHHLERFGTDDRGRLFTGVKGGPLPTITYRRAWRHARRQALTDLDYASPLAGSPYALRHTCVSTWLNAGVSETLVAHWAGHSVGVLKKIYAKCLVGEEARAKEQISQALKRG